MFDLKQQMSRKILLPDPEILKTERIPMLTEMLDHIKRNIILYNEKLSGEVLTIALTEFITLQLTRMYNRKARIERLLSDQKPSTKNVTICYADVIPELCLIRLLDYLQTEDSRNLYLALTPETQTQVEFIFIKNLYW